MNSTRRSWLFRLLSALGVGTIAPEVVEATPLKCVVPPELPWDAWYASVIQCLVKPGEKLVEPWQESDPTMERVWSNEITGPDGTTLHQRLYRPIGTTPDVIATPEVKGFDFETAHVRILPEGRVKWVNVAP